MSKEKSARNYKGFKNGTVRATVGAVKLAINGLKDTDEVLISGRTMASMASKEDTQVYKYIKGQMALVGVELTLGKVKVLVDEGDAGAVKMFEDGKRIISEYRASQAESK